MLYLKLREPDRAIRDFDQAVALNPRHMRAALKHRARAQNRRLHHERTPSPCYGVRQYDRAIRDLDRAINFSPDHASSFNLRGLCYAAIGETRRAIQDFDQAVQLDGKSRGSFRQPRQHLPERATSGNGRSPTTARRRGSSRKDAYSLYSRGLVMRALGREAEAAVDIARAKEIEPGIGP